MHDIRTDLPKKRLYITLGNLNRVDIQQCIIETESACKYLISGFTCLIVLNKKEPIHQSDLGFLNNLSDLLIVYGADKIVHVRKKESSFSLSPHFPVEYAKNIWKAEDILDEEN